MDKYFKEYITVEEFERISSLWEGEMPQGKHDWWKEYNEFATHFLQQVYIGPKYLGEILEDNYQEYLPILNKYFLNEEEYKTIAHNLACIKKETLDGIIDTPMFKVFTLLKTIGVLPNISELLKMDYKSFIKLYLYIMGDKLMPSNEQGVYHR